MRAQVCMSIRRPTRSRCVCLARVQRVENPMNYIMRFVWSLDGYGAWKDRGKTDKEERALLGATREKPHETYRNICRDSGSQRYCLLPQARNDQADKKSIPSKMKCTDKSARNTTHKKMHVEIWAGPLGPFYYNYYFVNTLREQFLAPRRLYADRHAPFGIFY